MIKTTAFAAIVAIAMGGSAFAQNNSGGGNNSQSEGLVNVSLGDVVVSQIAQDLNVDVSQIPVTVQVPVGVAANVCDVAANVLAAQKKTDGASCDAANSSEALTQVVQKQMKSQK